MNAEPMRDRRDACAWLQCLRHRPCLELVRPASAKLPRRTLKALGNSFDHMEGSSSRTRRRHRSSQQIIVSATNIPPITTSARRGLLAAYQKVVSRAFRMHRNYISYPTRTIGHRGRFQPSGRYRRAAPSTPGRLRVLNWRIPIVFFESLH